MKRSTYWDSLKFILIFLVVYTHTLSYTSITRSPSDYCNNSSSRQLRKLEDDVYKSFSLLIYRTIFIIHQRAERNEVMDYLKELAPDLNFTHGIRQYATTFMFRHMPHLFINAYYYYAKYAYKHGKD